MSKFIDGPAKGVTLTLGRAPLLLRVVQNTHGGWDALDQLDDQAKHDETIYVYRRVGEPTCLHIDGRDKSGRRFGKWLQNADYSLLVQQPPESVVRATAAWQAFCGELPSDWFTSPAALRLCDNGCTGGIGK